MRTVWLEENSVYALYPENIYLFKVNKGNTRKMFTICSKFTRETPERCQRCRPKLCYIFYEYFYGWLETGKGSLGSSVFAT